MMVITALWVFFFLFSRNVIGILSILSSCKDGCGALGRIASKIR